MSELSRRLLIGPPHRVARERWLADSGHGQDDWKIILRNPSGVVVLYNRTQRTLAVESPYQNNHRRLSASEISEPESDTSQAATPAASSCPLCKRPFPPGASASIRTPQVSSQLYLPYIREGENEQFSNDYFHLLSESLQPSPEITPEPSRPGTPAFAEVSGHLDDSSFLEGYYERFFVEVSQLGRGMSGSVFLCQHVLNGNPLGYFACKKIAIGNSSPSLVKALKEINHLESLRHPNIVAIHHVWLETSSLSLGPRVPCLFALMDYANDGTLEAYIRSRGGLPAPDVSDEMSPADLKAKAKERRRRGNKSALGERAVHLFSIDEIVSLASDISSGLAFLHAQNMLHLDLKAENVLLHRINDGVLLPTAMLSDFGSSEARNAMGRSERSGVTGTLDYLAPESFDVLPNGKPRQHCEALDLWALGLLLHLLAFFRLPYLETDIDALTSEIKAYSGFYRSTSPHRRRDLPEAYGDLLERLISIHANGRPRAEEVLEVVKALPSAKIAEARSRERLNFASTALVPAKKFVQLSSGILTRRTKLAQLPSPVKSSRSLPSIPELQANAGILGFASLVVRAAIIAQARLTKCRLSALNVSLPTLLLLTVSAVAETHFNISLFTSGLITCSLLVLLSVLPGRVVELFIC